MSVTVLVSVEETRFRIACKAGSTIEWLLKEASARYRAKQPERGVGVRADALLTADGSFLDPLDQVADVCESDEVLVAVLAAVEPAPGAPRPLSVEQMVLRLKTACDSSDTTTDSVFVDDDAMDLHRNVGDNHDDDDDDDDDDDEDDHVDVHADRFDVTSTLKRSSGDAISALRRNSMVSLTQCSLPLARHARSCNCQQTCLSFFSRFPTSPLLCSFPHSRRRWRARLSWSQAKRAARISPAR